MKKHHIKGERRLRVTVSLSSALLKKLSIESHKADSSRSAVMEELLLSAIQQREKSALDAEIEAYYRNRSPKESAEELAFGRAISRMRKKLVIDDPGASGTDW